MSTGDVAEVVAFLRDARSVLFVTGAGLSADLGDVLEQVVRSRAGSDSDPITGSVTGMRLDAVICQNVTTAQHVSIVPAGLATEWDCTTAGLDHLEGDRIRMSARGTSD